MKKTVSINIGSIIFHIEEDGYDKLKNYLDSVNRYFSTFEDSGEIIADIESRIAEIFLSKLADGRQTVNLEDVEELIATMGTTRDFEATIEAEPEEPKASSAQQEPQAEEPAPSATKRLYRDTKRKILGGVAAGIAHYFSIDPLWIRLLIVLLFINVFLGGLSGATLLAYIILWIVLPPNDTLEEDQKVKKLFRNSDERVLGGVASGIASYFGTDTTVIRLLFVLSIFLGGAGIVAYIILWIISPEAKTITEKMQMQGEPVTLSNIEENVKKGLNVKEGEENALVKILLFPFRLIALIITGIGRVLGPVLRFLAELIRIAFGVLLLIIGVSTMIGFIVAIFGILGIGGWENYVHLSDFPIELIQRSLDGWSIASVFIVMFIPALAVSLLGLVIILKRRVANAYVGWSLFTLWIVALIFAAVTVPRFAQEFATEDDLRVDKTYPVTAATPTLRLNDLGLDTFDAVDLRLRGHEDSTYQLLLNIESRGKNKRDAQANAQTIEYKVEQKGDDFYFDSKITFPEEANYRFQNVKAYFYIPFGKTFRMEEDLEEILINTLHINGYRPYQMEGNDWVFEQDGIKCLTCPDRSSKSFDKEMNRSEKSSSYSGSEKIDYPFEDFDEVKIASFFDVDIRQGDEWQVTVRGDDDDLDEVYLNQVGDRLEVKFKEDSWEWWKDKRSDKVGIFITMPKLQYLEVIGDTDGEVKGFDEDEITMELTGACDLYVNVNPRRLELTLTGASTMELRGEAEELNADLVGASRLEAFDFLARRVEVSAIGASKAEVNGSEEIEIDAAGVSKVKYRGTRNVKIDEDGISSVDRD
ncbi:MAG: PspC domain-containing protein [Marinoscillum sp.]|uniref:PspC domain-containing protein n=1 Tax=Marinoscillum sp. TaxID=2024838 RepID=UPI0032FDD63E